MAIYNSNSLGRSVLTSELPHLSPQDLRNLTEELFDCINEITTSLQEVADFEQNHGFEPDTEWCYRAKKKLRISTQFAAKIEAMDKPLPKSYKQLYQGHFKFSLLTRLQFALLAIISPQRLLTAITAGFLSAVESLEDDELRMLVKEISNEN
jgi:hypothetical protein